MSGEGPPAPPAPLPGPAPAPAPTPAPASAAPVAPKGVFQRTFNSFFVKSAATAEEKAVLQQQMEEQQKADLARLQQAKEVRAQREAEALFLWEAKFSLTDAHIHVQAQAHQHTCTHTNAHVHAYTHTCTGTGWAKCPPGLVQGRLKHLFTGSGVTFNIYEIWAPG